MIPCCDPHAGYVARKAEIDQAVMRALEGGRYILGEEVVQFEREFAAYVGVSHAVGVGNGTDALHLALRACGVGHGHEVITVSHTAVATVAAIELAGATPVLVDIEEGSYTLDPAQVEKAITPRTRCIVPVHLYGQPADLAPVLDLAQAHGLKVIEDCAQAHGACYHGRRVGTFGDCACFSFYPTKNLGAMGDGGAVVTGDGAIAERVRWLREYGWRERYVSSCPGINSRLDEIQAAILRVKLRYLDADNQARSRIAGIYQRGLADIPNLQLPLERQGRTHVYHLYVLRSARRDRLREWLRERGIGTNIHYPVPVHLQPAYVGRVAGHDLRVTVRIAKEILSLPMYPQLNESETHQVVEAIRQFGQGAEVR